MSSHAVVTGENRGGNPQTLKQFCEQPDSSPIESDVHQPLPPINIAREKRPPMQARARNFRIIVCEFRNF
jgi:hypothetical protein